MAKINCSFLPQSHRQTGQKVQAPEFYSTNLKWEGGGHRDYEWEVGYLLSIISYKVIRSVSNVLRAKSRFVKFVCVGGGGGVGVRNTRVGSLYYIYSNKRKPTRVFRMGGG